MYCHPYNYRDATRPAYATGLNFPDSWIIPPARHALALERISHLSVETADLSSPSSITPSKPGTSPTAAFDEPNAMNANVSTSKNPALARHLAAQQKVSSLLAKALNPVDPLLQSSSSAFLFGDGPSTADCLLIALLSLGLTTEVPDQFLAILIKRSFPNVTSYTIAGLESAFGGKVTVHDALVKAPVSSDEDDDDEVFDAYGNLNVGSGNVELPWRIARPMKMADVITSYALRAVEAANTAVATA